jgi:hypothetical protein
LLRIAPLTSTDPAEVAGGISRGAEDAMLATGAPSSVRARATRLASGLPKETRFVPLLHVFETSACPRAEFMTMQGAHAVPTRT